MSRITASLFLVALVLCACFSDAEGRSLFQRQKEKSSDKRTSKPAAKRIITKTDYPYACTVNVTQAETLCSGVLVDPSWVVTAAHCVEAARAKRLSVFCDGTETPLDVDEIVVHEEWIGIATLPNDIAMLKLAQPTRLPPAQIARKTTTFKGRTMYALELNNQNVTFQTISEAAVVAPEMCNSTSLWTRSIETSMICATVLNGKCISDTGSPLFLRLNAKENSALVFIGIASFGNQECVQYQFPVVYTSMTEHMEWIEAVIAGSVTISEEDEVEEEAEREKAIDKEFVSKSQKKILEGALDAIAVDDALKLTVLLDLGLAPDAKVDKSGRTLLHYCAETNAYQCAQVLVDFGATLGIVEKKSSATPLHFAAANGSIPVVEVLIDAGAYVDDVDKNGLTPLQYVILSKNGKITIIDYLLNAGASPHEVDKEGVTPLHYAAEENWLSAARALIHGGADVDVFADDGGSALHWASRSGSNDTLLVLIQSGILIESTSEKGLGESALLFAIRNEAPLSIVEILVKNGGANVNVVDRRGNSPLHRAAENGDVDVIQFLVTYNANTSVKNKKGKRPVDVFCNNFDCSKPKNKAIRELLKPPQAQAATPP